MRRLVPLATAVALSVGIGAAAWAQAGPTTTEPPPVTTIPDTTFPVTTVPGTTFPATTVPTEPTTTQCAIGTTTTFCFPVTTSPPSSVPSSEDCLSGRWTTTARPAKYAERAQAPQLALNLDCFKIRLLSPGVFVVSASDSDTQLLDLLFR